MAVQLPTISQQSPIPNSGTQGTLPSPSSSTLPERINPLVEQGPSVKFWQGRDVVPTTNVKAILRAYYSYQTVRNDRGDVEYHITTSSDKGNGHLPYSQSDWTLKIYDPTMVNLIAEHKINVFTSYRSDTQYSGFRIGEMKFVGNKDYIIVKIGEFDAYNIYRFDQNEANLTEIVTSVNNPTFVGKHLVSWTQGYPKFVSFRIYDLDGNLVKGPLQIEDSNHLWIDSKTQRIFVGLYHAQNWPRACYDVHGKKIQL